MVSSLKKETDMTRIEISELQTINSTLKTKLGEAQESLKSNENLIQYLNKQLNEKTNTINPGIISGQSTQSSFGGKLTQANFSGTIPIGGKPPASNTFKPTFSSIDQLNPSTTLGRSNSK